MELKQLEERQALDNSRSQEFELSSTQVSSRILQILINLNPCLSESETLLLSYYKRVRATWSASAIKTVQKATGLKLTNKLNRCRFAIAAAKFQLQWSQSPRAGDNYNLERKQLPVSSERKIEELPNINSGATFPEVEDSSNPVYSQLQNAIEQIEELESQLQEKERQLEQKKQKLEESKNFSVLLLTNRLLPAGLPLNGTEESPAMRILGSPLTLTELEANYRELIKREHPDVSPFPSTEAIERFAYVRSLYRITREYWQQLKPTAAIAEAELKKRMIAPVPFAPESFWAA
ncbi:MAG: J domain-containing protein [Pleurocapsa sp. MO_226.B13]|nr:J domain-containing protein [Pleurocapsa sp. MO_226.B13]